MGILRRVFLFLLASLFGSAGAQPAAKEGECILRVVATVPEGTEKVFIAGNAASLGNWDAGSVELKKTSATKHEFSASFPRGTHIEFKLTAGTWETEAVSAKGVAPPNHSVELKEDTTLEIEIPAFKETLAAMLASINERGTVSAGKVHVLGEVVSKYLDYPRNVLVWTPDGYDATKECYAVLYMHDGQNLFDARMSAGGVEWGVDENVSKLVKEGKMPPIIVVGVFNTPDRMTEYAAGTGGDKYAKFLIEELKPRIDRDFRTIPDAQHTGTMGSSMGGQISLWLGWKYHATFGRAGCLSCYLGKNYSTIGLLKKVGPAPLNTRIWVDHGSKEGSREYSFGPGQVELEKLLSVGSLKPGVDFVCHVEPGAEHDEFHWRQRLEKPLLFLFGNQTEPKAK